MGATVELKQFRFLVVDDDPAVLDTVETQLVLANAGQVYKAADVQSAINVFADPRTKVDCIVSDYDMRPVNGLMFLRQIRSGQLRMIHPTMPFIMLTGFGQESVVRAAVELDVSTYMVKPVSRDALVKAVNRALSRRLTPKQPRDYAAVALP